MNRFKKAIAILLALALLSACGAAPAPSESSEPEPESSSAPAAPSEPAPEPEPEPEAKAAEGYLDPVTMAGVDLQEELAPLVTNPPLDPELLPVASGTSLASESGAEIDYSNIRNGYVMAHYTGGASGRLKVQILGPVTTYFYNLYSGVWAAYPLSDGNGEYTVRVLQNVEENKYSILTSATFTANMKDEFAPFLSSNQYVNYGIAEATVQKAAELTENSEQPLDKVKDVYDFVLGNFTYDESKVADITTGYLPVLDEILEQKGGTCFDCAALMTGMLRSQEVPCKLVVGYAGSAYHAWISVWTEETGWVDSMIFFDGTTWQRMEPELAADGSGDAFVQQYIGNGSGYTVKYLY